MPLCTLMRVRTHPRLDDASSSASCAYKKGGTVEDYWGETYLVQDPQWKGCRSSSS
ncbi:hypothetical protein PIB30_033931 [Stylosanthes scabra]|uniref:Uncharacterized protein n=1 Tax=Stylosanthes scabra TaxID=79078 RepID=A0ABU6Y9X1_9FABA|nr:hypothetical protein [Stylosanthes scabra]